jgi:tetratricopeptide (TPR) repeat protein
MSGFIGSSTVYSILSRRCGATIHERRTFFIRPLNICLNDHRNDTLRDPPPAKPAIFFGRDALVRGVVTALLKHDHVALIGPGGIGKSSVAKAILHDDAIKERFKDDRFFVRFDDMDASQVTCGTFLNRVANCLGVKASKGTARKLVSSYLSAHRVLLVFDNAETFLEALADRDAAEIATIIDEFGSLSSVTLMLTTRSRSLPSNLLCNHITIPSLEQYAARDAFTTVYQNSIPPAIVDRLLSALDFHPLSINLLAQVAVQNQWPPEDLVEAWEREKIRLLEVGRGKVQSLAVTIELSLNSRSVQALAVKAPHLLQIVAFLPQGVDKKNLTALLPDETGVHTVVDTLCRLSLVYYNGNYITMLAPIRLYIMSTYDDTEFLDTVRSFYYPRLKSDDDGQWIVTEDINVERLIAHDLTIRRNLKETCEFCISFLRHLREHKVRPTGLGPIVQALPKHFSSPRTLLGIRLPRVFSKHRSLIAKANCLLASAGLANDTHQITEALQLCEAAKTLFSQVNDKENMIACIVMLGEAHTFLGNITRAEELFTAGLDIARANRDAKSEASLSLQLSAAASFRGSPGAIEKTKAAQRYFESQQDNRGVTAAMFLHGWIAYAGDDYLSARLQWEACRDRVKHSHDKAERSTYSDILEHLSLIAHREGKLSYGHEMLDESYKLYLDLADNTSALFTLAKKAVLIADEGDFDASRKLMANVFQGITSGNQEFLRPASLYISARTELLAKNYSEAKILFRQSIDLCDIEGDNVGKAIGIRTLGEIAVLEQDIEEAQRLFTQALSLCKSMGVLPKMISISFDIYTLNDSIYNGWVLFQEGRLGHSTTLS